MVLPMSTAPGEQALLYFDAVLLGLVFGQAYPGYFGVGDSYAAVEDLYLTTMLSLTTMTAFIHRSQHDCPHCSQS
jgi:hypothetical protein